MRYVFGEWRLDTQRAELSRAGDVRRLRRKVCQVLAYLLAQADRVVSKQELYEQIWPQQFVSDAALESVIKAVRQALGDNGRDQRLIQTVYGQGYRCVAAVTAGAPASPASVSVRTPRREGLPPVLAEPRTPVVGREGELTQLSRWWARVQEGERHLVFVTGEPGIGKTTLVDAFLHRLSGETPCDIARGQCVEQFGVGEPYRPVLEALGRLGRGPRGPEVVAVLEAQAPTWLAQQADEPTHVLEAHIYLGLTLTFLGEYSRARLHLDQGRALTEPPEPPVRVQRSSIIVPEVACRIYAVPMLWCLGYPVQALRQSQDARAQALAHPYSLAMARHFAAFLHYLRRDAAAVQAEADALLSLATTHAFPYWAVAGRVWQGWAWAMLGAGEVGIAQIRQELAATEALEHALARPVWLLLLAEAAGHGGHVAEGLGWLAEARTAFEATGRGDLLAEAYRLQGTLLGRQAGRHAAQAETCFQHALAIARRQQARSLELRAAMSLARLWQEQGKRVEAGALLAPIYGWFTEGFDTADLQEARALLDALGG